MTNLNELKAMCFQFYSLATSYKRLPIKTKSFKKGNNLKYMYKTVKQTKRKW